MTTPPTRYERRKARTRSALVGAARRLFADRGFDSTTIAQIAEEADTAHGSFYNHFRTKEDVLEAVFEESLSDQFRLLAGRHDGIDDPAERVSIGHRHLLEAVRNDPEWGWLLVRLDVSRQVIARVLGEDALKDLRAGLKSGRFSVPDAEVALHASGGALIAVIHLILREGRDESADTAHAEGVLRTFGLPAKEAAKVASRPLPDPDGA